jgi:hypothetical protein
MTLYLHVICLLLAATASAVALVAVWAATSRRHWFWRALAIWACAAALLPIRAYEPALVLTISLPIAALAIRGLVCLRQQQSEHRRWLPARISAIRFQINDLLMAIALLGVALATLLHIARSLPARPTPPRTATEIALPAIAVVMVTVLCWCLVCGPRRLLSAVGVTVVIPVLGWFMWPAVPWLHVLDSDFGMYLIAPSGDVDRRGLFMAILGHAEFAAFLTIALATMRLALPPTDRGRRWHVVQMGIGTLIACGLSLLYLQLLRFSPFPPPLVPAENHYQRIRQIAQRVEILNAKSVSMADLETSHPEAANELQSLYQELFPLLESPNALPDDLATGRWQAIDARTSSEWIATMRVLGRALAAESKSAEAAGDIRRAIDFAMADIRLGTMLCRNAIMIDVLVGLAVVNQGSPQVAALRDRLDPAASRATSEALRSLEASLEPEERIVLRDIAFCERAYGWQARLSSIIENLIAGPPLTRESYWSWVAAIDYWRAQCRLLQADLAVRRFQDQHGNFPDKLAKLIPNELPALPLDPFTQQPLVYRMAGSEFTLYSVGRDRHDNGGQFTNRTTYHGNNGYDLDLDTLTRP